MTRKILITGGAGMLAERLTKRFESTDWEAHPIARTDLDITDEQQVLACINELKPAAVINTAALLVEPCEANPEQAFKINAWGVRNLARACDANNAKLVQISTSGIFGDAVKAYTEFDATVNKTQYAASKYAGEQFAATWCEKHFILRLGWLYGGALDGRKDFVTARLAEAEQARISNGTLGSAGDKFGCPTNANDVADTMFTLLKTEAYGLYHCANEADEPCSRADYVETIVRGAGIDIPVLRTDSSQFPRTADVPDCEWLTSYSLSYAGIGKLPHWKESLERYMNEIKGA